MSKRAGNAATRWTARLGLAALTVIAAVVSYLHCLPVVQAADGTGRVAYLVPLLADLLIAVSTANILDAQHNGERWPRLSVVAVCIGALVTLGMNVAAASPHVWPPWLVNAWPPVAFLLALESFAGHLRRGRAAPPAPSVAATQDHDEPLTTDQALRLLLGTASQRKLAAHLGVPRNRVQSWAGCAAAVDEDTTGGEPPHSSPVGQVPAAPAGSGEGGGLDVSPAALTALNGHARG